MKIFKDKLILNKEISSVKNLSFVPTMGGLHNGHKYLIKKAKKINNKVLVSIFVNPKQFNSKKDYKTYPRSLKKDLNILNKLKVNYVFLPNEMDIFQFQPIKKIFADKFIRKLCGKFRKNHFEGVLNVVNRLLEIVKPNHIFLGEKDYQQLYLIQKHIKKRKIATRVISCKTIRENNGLACSSRNNNLNKYEKKIASLVFKILNHEKKLIKKNKIFKINIKKITNKLMSLGIGKIEYIEALNLKTLKKPKFSKSKYKIFISFYIDKIRLIDNI
jgi:pantoate--beta-alanine ligase